MIREVFQTERCYQVCFLCGNDWSRGQIWQSNLVPIAGVGGVNDLATILCCKVGLLPMTFVGFPVG